MVKSATLRLIEAAERLNMTGVIGDGTVAHFHELAALARLEQAGTNDHLCQYPAPYGRHANGEPKQLADCA